MIKIFKKLQHDKVHLAILAVLIFEFAFPSYASADVITQNLTNTTVVNAVVTTTTDANEQNSLIFLAVPRRTYTVVASYNIPVTAYSSTIDQTDSTPCHTANNFDLCSHNQEDVIAANFLPFGTKVRFPELYGDRIFTVQDRMNARYFYRADVWMRERADAIKFGIAYATIEVVQ